MTDTSEHLVKSALYPPAAGFTKKRKDGAKMLFQWRGEMRPPRAGEYFLSGSIIEAYRAENDLDWNYAIAVPVWVKEKVVQKVIEDVKRGIL